MSAKSKAKSQPARNGPPATTEVLTQSEVAAFLRVPEATVLEAVTKGGLPARRIGSEWRFLKDAIIEWLRRPEPTAEVRRKSMMAVVGSLKDDETLDAMVEEIYRQRKQDLVGG